MHRRRVGHSLRGTTARQTASFTSGRSKAERACAEGILRSLGRLLPSGLVAATKSFGCGIFVCANASAPRTSIATRFAAVSEL